MVAPGGQRPSTYHDWFIQVDEDLDHQKNFSEGNATPHIFRVPIQIREVSKDSFDSKFPFGLYDLERRPNSVLDIYRKYFAESFMQITGKGWKEICSEVVGCSPEEVKSWVKLYDGLQLDSITVGKANSRVGDPLTEGNGIEQSQNGSLSQAELSRIDFIKSWLTLDAITIVCFIRADHERVCRAKLCKNTHFPQLGEAMKIKTLKSIVHMIRLDIFKFENQVPLGLIRKVVTLMAKGDETPALFRNFVVDAVNLIYCDLPGPRTSKEFEDSVNRINIEECKHLLQCLYLVICRTPSEQVPAPTAGSSWSASIFKCLQSFRRPGGQHKRRSAPGSAQHQETALLVTPSSNVDSQQPAGARRQLQGSPGTSGSRVSEIELADISPYQSDAGGGHASQNPQAQASTGDGNSKRCEMPGHYIPVTLGMNVPCLHQEPHHHHHDVPLVTHIPTVTHLKEAGISVIVGQGDLKTKYISDVKFKHSTFLKFRTFQGKLYIPAIGVYDETESLLRNLLTYEYVVEDKKDLLSFVYLMDNLIDTEQDVKMMMDSGVLKNKSLGSDKRVANMWNTLLTGVVLSISPPYTTLFQDISKHYRKKSSKLAAEFRTIHPLKPWVVVGSFLVVTTFIATVLAMVYTILTYYYGNKQRKQS